MLDARFSHLYFYQSLNRLQRGLSAIAELLVPIALSEVMKVFSCKLKVEEGPALRPITVQQLSIRTLFNLLLLHRYFLFCFTCRTKIATC